MKKFIHYAPSQDEVYTYHMQKSTEGSYDHYRINLAMTSASQKERLSQRYGIPLRILEDEHTLILAVIKEY